MIVPCSREEISSERGGVLGLCVRALHTTFVHEDEVGAIFRLLISA